MGYHNEGLNVKKGLYSISSIRASKGGVVEIICVNPISKHRFASG